MPCPCPCPPPLPHPSAHPPPPIKKSIFFVKLKRVQNSAPKSVMKSHKCDHVQPLLRILHWWSVPSRIVYKISTLCFNSFTNSYPVYIAQLQSISTPSRHLRSSSDTCTLHIPFIKIKSFGQRAFSFTCPTQWNLLPSGL